MAGVSRISLILGAFAIVSVLLTASAAWLALRRPDAERLNVETRSRLVADYSVDSVARRIEPLDPEIVRAAANDEVKLMEVKPAETARRVEPVNVTPVATAMPTATPKPGETPKASPAATSTSRPGSPTATLKPGEPTPTAAPSATPAPTKTPETKPTPTSTRPVIDPTALPTLNPTLVPTIIGTAKPEPTETPRPTEVPADTPTPVPTATPTRTPTPQPTSIIGNVLNVLSCSLAKSGQGTNDTTITFINQRDETVMIYELPILIGPMTLTATLGAGEQTTISTLSGTAFKVTTVEGSCIAVFRANGQPGYAIIE